MSIPQQFAVKVWIIKKLSRRRPRTLIYPLTCSKLELVREAILPNTEITLSNLHHNVNS
jgi:hypothetical protein